MSIKSSLCIGAAKVLFLAVLMTGSQSTQAQDSNASENVTMTLFKIVNQSGKKYLETQTGEFLPIDGKNLAKDATVVAIYRDDNANYWFINKNGKPTSIPPQRVQWAINEISQQRYAKESALAASGSAPVSTYPASSYPSQPVQQTTIIQQPSNGSNGGSGSSALVTGAAAAGGAMLGGLIGSSIYDNGHYYGIPYGAPCYRYGGSPFYYNNGNRVYVNNEHVDPVVKQWNAQGNWNNRNTWANTDRHYNGVREGWGGFRGFRR